MNEQIKSVPRYMRKRTGIYAVPFVYRCLFFGSFFVAIFAANTAWKNEASWIGFLNESSFLAFVPLDGSVTDRMLLIFRQRLPVWILMVAFSQSIPGFLLAGVFAGWQGFSFGFIFSSLLARYGIRGISVFVLMCFPQWLFYLLSILCFYRLMIRFRCRHLADREQGMRNAVKMRTLYILFCILFSGIYVAGMLTECYVNPFFLNRTSDFITNF